MLGDTLDPDTLGSVLLIVDAPDEHVRRVEHALRDAALGARIAHVADLEELEDALVRGAPDVVFCGESSTLAPYAAAIALCQRISPELPVLVLAEAPDFAAAAAAIRQGAEGRVVCGSDDSLKHLCEVYRRECRNLRQGRELRLARARIADLEMRLRRGFDEDPDPLLHLEDGVIVGANLALSRLLKREPASLLGVGLLELVPEERQQRVKERLRALARARQIDQPLESAFKRQDGQAIPIKARATVGRNGDRDFIELRVDGEAARLAAPPDPTPPDASVRPAHVANRTAMFKMLAAAPKSPRPRALLLFAVDEFVALETRLGFEEAELLMARVQTALASRLGAGEIVFRFSTHEWIALMSRATAAEFEKLAERLCRELGAQVFTNGRHETRVSASVYAYPIAPDEPATQSIDPLVREARLRLAKGGGRSAVLGPTAEAQAQAREQARRAAQLKRAIEENRLRLVYQSIASLEGEPRPHFDVLVRMVDETGRELRASEFVGAAVRFGLMRAVDRWVTAQSLKVLGKRDRAAEPSVLMVKLSEETLRDAEAFLTWLKTLLPAPLTHQELCFTTQELTAQDHLLKTQWLAQRLAELGIGLSLDHFGAGSQSAQLLQQLPVRFAKFHANYTRNFSDAAVQKKMTELLTVARERNVRTIVSHVEDANLMARMWSLGVHYIQGYHVQEPEAVLVAADPVRS